MGRKKQKKVRHFPHQNRVPQKLADHGKISLTAALLHVFKPVAAPVDIADIKKAVDAIPMQDRTVERIKMIIEQIPRINQRN